MIVGSLDGIEEKARRLVDLVYARQIDGVIVLTGRLPVINGRSLRDAGVPIVRRPTGVVCCSDEMAIGFIKTVTCAGVVVPDEVSVIGFDGIEFADSCEPTLTTIRQPRRELGAAGARALLASLQGVPRDGDNPIVLPGELLIRDSTGPAPDSRKQQSRFATGKAADSSPGGAKTERPAT